MLAEPTGDGSRWRRFYTVGAASAVMLDVLFLMGATSLVFSVLGFDPIDRWLVPLQNNWLIVLFKLNARFGGVSLDLLDPNPLDLIIMVLACVAFPALYPIFRRVSATWTLVALALPPTGLLLFLVTRMSGRLGTVSAILILAFLMLWSDSFGRTTAVMGILAGVLVIAGDALTEVEFSIINSVLIAAGYLLMVTWLSVTIRRSLQLSGVYERRSTCGGANRRV